MSVKSIVSLLAICLFCFSCTSNKQLPASKNSAKNIDFILKYPPEETAIVTLKLEGKTLPGTPKVVEANDTTSAFFEQMGSSEEIKQMTENIWVTALKSGDSYVIGWIVEDNKMFGYCSEPFVAKNGLDVTFSPGVPATLEFDISKSKEGVDIFPAILVVSRKAANNGKLAILDYITKIIEKPKVEKIAGLAQGTFQIWAQSLKAEENIDSRKMFLYDKRFIEIEQGKVNRVEAEFPSVDNTVEDGDVNIKGLAYNSAGELLANETIKLIPINNNAPRFDLYYPEVISDSNGHFEFKGVQPDINVIIKTVGGSTNLIPKYMAKNMNLWVELLLGKLNQQIFTEYAIPDFQVVWNDGQSGSILNLFGKIAVINVWSSSYPPSQKALSEFNSLAKEYKDNEDIVFIAMSVDYNRKNWEDAINKMDYDGLRHCWYEIDNDLALNRPIPYSIIFDKKNIVHAEGVNLDIREELKKVIEASKN